MSRPENTKLESIQSVAQAADIDYVVVRQER